MVIFSVGFLIYNVHAMSRVFLNLAPVTHKMLLLAVLLVPVAATGQVTYRNNTLSIASDLFQKHLGINKSSPGPVYIHAMLDTNGNNIIGGRAIKPLFEFVLDGRKITALDPVWRYFDHEIRQMENGGTEIKVIVKGVLFPVKGLRLILYQQFFPGTTLIREKLVLSAEGGRQFRLSKFEGKLHFVFPQYIVKVGNALRSTEIRIASWASELIDTDGAASYDERFQGGKFNDLNLAQNHMYHPRILEWDLTEEGPICVKGPLNIINTGNVHWITAYEHASQDDLRGLFRTEAVQEGDMIRDASQGTKGVFNFSVSAVDFHFLGIAQESIGEEVRVAVEALRGAYLDGEVIDKDHPYSSVWSASAYGVGNSMQESMAIIHDYLWRCICEKPASRQPEFYYNTWGMQRRLSSKGQDLRGVFTENKIREEIQRAAELGVDIFVLDDGWEQAQGEWSPHRERLPKGLAPIKAELDKHGIKMGIWLSPMGIDSTVGRYREHPEWIIKDSEGNPILAQWNHPAFDFVSGFYNVFIEDCKKLIDAGARFFKWDAINTFYSCLPNLDHGSDAYPEEEIRARYEYLLPLYVTKAMEALTEYEPDLVIEVDLTEARRVMVGLAPLSQGKLFWMNNGASSYNDYSVYRAKSMRSIPNRYAGIIPLELFTYANYPHNDRMAQRYNVNTSLIAGHGFWGALEEMTDVERLSVGQIVAKSKRVLPYIKDCVPEVIGRIGGTPEIYTQVNHSAGAGQVIAFSGSAAEYTHCVPLECNKVLGVLNNAFTLNDNELVLHFEFPMPDATREAFIIPNLGSGVSMISSTSWIDDLTFDNTIMTYVSGAPGKQVILWDKKYGVPQRNEDAGFTIMVLPKDEYYVLNVVVDKPGQKVWITGLSQ